MTELATVQGSAPVVKSTTTEMVTTRQAQEVQAAMVVAKKFPRDELAAIQRIKQACKRPVLAEAAQYSFPRGRETVSGPSIRLAEVMAQNWGNLSFGVVELSNENGKSECMSYAWDLETNMRVDKIFTVEHWRDTKNGGYALKDKRDIYELVANQGARRLRACILAVIPGDVVDSALEACDKTLAGDQGVPMKERLVKMLDKFSKYQVDQQMIEDHLGHKLQATSETELVGLVKIFNALKDGMGKREDYFTVAKAAAEVESGGFELEEPKGDEKKKEGAK